MNGDVLSSLLGDDDELFEAYDADIPRVDLVKTSANGTSFLLMKGAAGSLLSTEQVEDVIKAARPRVSTGKTFTNPTDPLDVGDPFKTILNHARHALAKSAAQVPVYDENGKLLGTTDPSKVRPILMPGAPGPYSATLDRFTAPPDD